MSILQGSLGNGGLPPLSAAVLERHGRGAVGLPPIAPLLSHVRPLSLHRIDASSEVSLHCLGISIPLCRCGRVLTHALDDIDGDTTS